MKEEEERAHSKKMDRLWGKGWGGFPQPAVP